MLRVPMTSVQLARQIAELRRARGLSEGQLAERAQIPVQVVRRVERGQDITLGALGRLARGLGAKIEIQLAPQAGGGTRADSPVKRLRAALARIPLDRYAVGEIVAEVRRATAFHGTSGVAALSRATGEDEASLYRFANVAECWSAAAVRKLLAQPKEPRAGRLSWSHLVRLATIGDATERDRWITRVRRQGLSVRQFQARLLRSR